MIKNVVASFAVIFSAAFVAVAQYASTNQIPSIPSPRHLQVGKITQLTRDTRFCSRPAWSPDGKKIAFTTGKSSGIEIMNSDGSNRRLVTKDAGAGYKFTWSPDSVAIAFRKVDFTNGLQTIKVVNVENGKVENISQPGKNRQPPFWSSSSEGHRVSFVDNGTIAHGNWRKTTQKPTATGGNQKTFFFDQQNIWLLDKDKKEPQRLTTGVGFDPVPSPDGTKIVYSQFDTLVMMNPDGTGKTNLCVGIHPSWSPDGKKLVFQITRDHSHDTNDPRQHTPASLPHRHDDKTNHQIVDSDLYLINADGSELTQLTKTDDKLEVDPGWSPDGRRIVYRTEDTGQIFLLELTW